MNGAPVEVSGRRLQRMRHVTTTTLSIPPDPGHLPTAVYSSSTKMKLCSAINAKRTCSPILVMEIRSNRPRAQTRGPERRPRAMWEDFTLALYVVGLGAAIIVMLAELTYVLNLSRSRSAP
jgi:hypothetical protein